MIEDFVSDNRDHLETLSVGHAVHKHIPMQANELVLLGWMSKLCTHFRRLTCFELSKLYSSCAFDQSWVRHVFALSYLTSGVNDLREVALTIVLDLSTERILDCRIIALDKVSFDKLDCQRRLACGLIEYCGQARARVQGVPTDLEPRMAIFRCLTDGAIKAAETPMSA